MGYIIGSRQGHLNPRSRNKLQRKPEIVQPCYEQPCYEHQQIRQISVSWTPEQALGWSFREFGDEIAVAPGFGAEGIVVIDLASRLCPKLGVFVLGTEFLFPETYELMDRVERRYGISVELVLPDLSAEVQARVHGLALWTRNPDQCCALPKVEPLRRKLGRLRAWITAIRRD